MHIEQTQHILSAQAFRQNYYIYQRVAAPASSSMSLKKCPQPLLLSSSRCVSSSQRIRFIFFFVLSDEWNERIRMNCCMQVSLWAMCALINPQKTHSTHTHTDMSNERLPPLRPHVLLSNIKLHVFSSMNHQRWGAHCIFRNIQCKIDMLVDASHSNLRMFFVFVVLWFWYSVFSRFNSNVVSLRFTV